jgi:hypothetical protein
MGAGRNQRKVERRMRRMKITLRDALTVVGTVLVVGLLIWGLNIKRMVDQHNVLVLEITKLIQAQNEAGGQPPAPEAPKEP